MARQFLLRGLITRRIVYFFKYASKFDKPKKFAGTLETLQCCYMFRFSAGLREMSPPKRPDRL
jgi:hypothetical protein